MSSSRQSSIWLHFTGVAGTGMSALAQFHALSGGITTGSDRSFDCGEQPDLRARLEELGIVILPQDGTFPSWRPVEKTQTDEPGDRTCAALIASTAIEDRIPDIRAAKEAGIPILHRSELLARHVSDHRTIAVTGTSGKSTVTAMVFSILRNCGRQPGLLTGGALAELTAIGHVGNAWAPGGRSRDHSPPLLVIEADESDGSLTRYSPWAGVVLNLGLDHKEPQEVLAMFQTFADKTEGPFLVGLGPELAALHENGMVFGTEGTACPESLEPPDPTRSFIARDIVLGPAGSSFSINGIKFKLPVPGHFNVLNATASLAICRQTGLSLEEMAPALSNFGGVARRFQSVGIAAGVEVIDDFAHNPDKIGAALATARSRFTDRSGNSGRILAVFQPHGFGPTRFLRTALVETFVHELRRQDILWMPEIFFAGGTAQKDISAADLIEDISHLGKDARFIAERQEIANAIAAVATDGDLVIVMGARDPSLTSFCEDILKKLGDQISG
ncbi:MAG: hypothetical protein KOO60_09215 [Gemmatimonadales bacterium]|nr:hypothetical protein [Gemmatimonadales bacterium]